MINLEQVKLLETKVAKAIDYIERLTGENAALNQREAEQQKKLENYQKRIDELEVLVLRFKEDQGQIEDSFFATLDRLSQFEDAMEKCLNTGKEKAPASAAPASAAPAAKPVKTVKQPAPPNASASQTAAPKPENVKPAVQSDDLVDGKICFEIPESESSVQDIDDITDPLAEDIPEKDGELEIF